MDDDLDLFGWVGGTVDGKYRVDRVVGRGGFGVVYRAHHLGFDQTVALKCLLLPKTLNGPERDRFQETFLAEGRLLHQLSRATAGIVQALDLGAAVSPNKTWTPYLVLEWLEGRPLDRDFAERRSSGQGGRSIADAIELLGPAARSLEVAHAQGVAHRDIKPANLFIATIAGRPVVKVLDFGIAKVMSETESVTRAFEETGASLQAFTARYGAPEQFSRRYGATGPWTDVFAFALVFVEAVTGKYALDGTDAAQLFVAAADPARRPTLRAVGHTAPDAIEDVMKRALAIDPRERYATAGEFWSALELAARGTGLLPLESDSKGRPGSVADSTSAPEPGLVPIGPDAPTSAEPGAHVRTELSSSTHVASSGAASPPSSVRRGSSFGLVVVLGAAALVTGAVGTFAVRTALSEREVQHNQPPVSAALPEPGAAPSANATREPDAEGRSVPDSRGTTAASAPAPAAAANKAAEPAMFGGVPERSVPSGVTGDAFVRGFRVLTREGAYGLDFSSATKLCADVGMALCTESQWAHACQSFPELGKAQSWTASVNDDGVVVRGGGACENTGIAPPESSSASRFAPCCERAIAMTTGNLQKQYLATTGERVLLVERALNQRNVQALLDLAEPTVEIDGEPKTLAQLGALLRRDFAAAPDLVVLNDVCKVEVQAKKVTKRTRRKKKVVSYETQGWTAECRQTAVLAGQVTSRTITYSFSAKSKLREIRTKPAE
jgi:serine/threonine-protein kinase